MAIPIDAGDGQRSLSCVQRRKPYGQVQGTALGSFGFTGELQQNANVYLRARWYDAGRGRFVGRDPFAGWGEQPYSLHPYQYGYADPVRWTDPTGECIEWIWGDPNCQFIGWERIQRGDLEWEEGRPWAGAGVDFTPGLGDAKGLVEVFTGCDLVTGEDLGNWRWLGLLALSELRHLRHTDDVLHVSDNIARGGLKTVRREIRIIGFQGIGFDPRRYTDPGLVQEDTLIKSGHVGISFDGGRTIYGFHPTQAALDHADVTAVGGSLEHLKNGGALLGMVYNDTELFHRAHALSDKQRTAVFQIVYEMGEEEYNQIVEAFNMQVSAGDNLWAWYRFPDLQGTSMPPECNNCATWPRTLGIPVPETTGQLRDYINLLKERGKPWP